METRDEPCRLCGAAQEDPYHILLECSHPSLEAARCTDEELAQGVTLLADELLRAHVNFEPRGATSQRVHTLRDLIASGAPQLSLASDTGRSLAWRLLTALPYPRCKAGSPVGPADNLGEIFDATTLERRYLRRYANRWCSWALTRVNRAAEAWRGAMREARHEDDAS